MNVEIFTPFLFFPLSIFCRFNFWVHAIIIKLVPCVVLTAINFVLIQVLCQAGKRKMKLKEYSAATLISSNGQRWVKSKSLSC